MLANEVGAALQLARDIDSACRRRNWSEASDQCDKARTSLAQICDHQGLEQAEREQVRFAIAQLGNLLLYLQKRDATERISDQKLKILHDMIIDLSRIQGRLQSETWEL